MTSTVVQQSNQHKTSGEDGLCSTLGFRMMPPLLKRKNLTLLKGAKLSHLNGGPPGISARSENATSLPALPN